MRSWLQHNLNALHLSYRLIGLGVTPSVAMWLGGTIGGLARPFIYRRAR